MKSNKTELNDFSEYFLTLDDNLKKSITLFKAISIIWQDKMRILESKSADSIHTDDLIYLAARLICTACDLQESAGDMLACITDINPYDIIDHTERKSHENSKKD